MTETFNLLDEPWIRVVDLNDELADLSLLEVFDRAHEVRRMVGDVPTQEAALVRLLLAVLHRAVPIEEADYPDEVWKGLWDRGRFGGLPRDYLERWRDRFDVLHPVTPFLQVPDLHTAKGEFTSLARLVPDVPAGWQYFTTRTLSSLAAMPLADAARWLVHAQAFDPSGIKSGAVGDPRVKGGRGYPIGVAWAGNLGLVVLEGSTLFETLLLNLDLAANTRGDTALWEREQLGAAVEDRSPREPRGVADLLTWPSRRLRLITEGDVATHALVCNGDDLHPRNQARWERMTAWRRSPAQEKKEQLAHAVMPREHLTDRALWRGLGAVLARGPEGGAGTGEKPGTLAWIDRLKRSKALAPDFQVDLHAIGIAYGSQNSVIDDLYDDRVHAQLATITDPQLQKLAVLAIGDADRACRALGDLARNLVIAAGGDQDTDAARAARERGYHALGVDYREWLARLGPDVDRDAERTQWQRVVRRTVTRLGMAQIREAGEPAWLGREHPPGSGKQLNTAVAMTYFTSTLRKALMSDGAREETA